MTNRGHIIEAKTSQQKQVAMRRRKVLRVEEAPKIKMV